jgi:hypothetical protein
LDVINLKEVVFFDEIGFRCTLFRTTKIVTIVSRYQMQIGDKVTNISFAWKSPDQTQKLSFTVQFK